MDGFLPVNAQEMRELGWERPDFVYILGDAYVDHPSFGHAIISRVLERAGYRVAMLSQPDWKDPGIGQCLRRPPPGLSGHRRQYGLHGQPLLRGKAPPQNRRL